MPIGLFGFAWTSFGPSQAPWIAPMIFSALVGMADVSTSTHTMFLDLPSLQYAICMSVIDYLTVAYGPFASSAAGAVAFSEDALAAASTMYANPCK